VRAAEAPTWHLRERARQERRRSASADRRLHPSDCPLPPPFERFSSFSSITSTHSLFPPPVAVHPVFPPPSDKRMSVLAPVKREERSDPMAVDTDPTSCAPYLSPASSPNAFLKINASQGDYSSHDDFFSSVRQIHNMSPIVGLACPRGASLACSLAF